MDMLVFLIYKAIANLLLIESGWLLGLFKFKLVAPMIVVVAKGSEGEVLNAEFLR